MDTSSTYPRSTSKRSSLAAAEGEKKSIALRQRQQQQRCRSPLATSVTPVSNTSSLLAAAPTAVVINSNWWLADHPNPPPPPPSVVRTTGKRRCHNIMRRQHHHQQQKTTTTRKQVASRRDNHGRDRGGGNKDGKDESNNRRTKDMHVSTRQQGLGLDPNRFCVVACDKRTIDLMRILMILIGLAAAASAATTTMERETLHRSVMAVSAAEDAAAADDATGAAFKAEAKRNEATTVGGHHLDTVNDVSGSVPRAVSLEVVEARRTAKEDNDDACTAHHNAALEDDTDTDDGESSNPTSVTHKDVIIVSAVDGSMAGISKRTGETLWRKKPRRRNSRVGTRFRTAHKQGGVDHDDDDESSDLSSSTLLFEPLVSTTTTAKSYAGNGNWRTSAVPSIDGRVYLTAPIVASSSSSSSGRDNSGGGGDVTVTTNMVDLVSRVPFVDSRGRLYTGYRRAAAVAIDGWTGEVLRVVSAADAPRALSEAWKKSRHREQKQEQQERRREGGREEQEQEQDAEDDEQGENTVWMGRVDYSVSIHEPRSGDLDVQFSASEIMSVNDMVIKSGPHQPWGGNGDDELIAGGGSSAAGFRAGDVRDLSSTSALTSVVATPNGNVALRDDASGEILWVADRSFETAVAFALDAASGDSIRVDIVPDAAEPNGSPEYRASEMRRQLRLLLSSSSETDATDAAQDDSYNDDDDDIKSSLSLNDGGGDNDDEKTICGSLPETGQLYAMPLVVKAVAAGQKEKGQDGGKPTLVNPAGAASKAHQSASAQRYHHHHPPKKTKSLPQLGASHHGPHLQNPNQHHQPSTKTATTKTATGRKPACAPGSSNFPACLVGGGGNDHHRRDPFARGPAGFLSEAGPSPPSSHLHHHQQRQQRQREGDTAVVPFLQQQHHHRHHPDYSGYLLPPQVPPEQFYATLTDPEQQQQQLRPKKRYWIKILGSWLPPTIALIFVVSFELGRRKRQKDLQRMQLKLDSNEVGATGGGGHGFRSGDRSAVTSDGTPTSGAAYSSFTVAAATTGTTNATTGVIQVSDDIILGYGGHGTVVYRGKLEGRDVAVKRMLSAYHAAADREISLLIESDGHPNVVRYFLKEVRGDFVYLALELCDLSLHDLVATLRNRIEEEAAAAAAANARDGHEDKGDTDPERGKGGIVVSSATKDILLQIAVGVRHLHRLRIVHRDLKPANILLADSKKSSKTKKNPERDGDNGDRPPAAPATSPLSVYERFERGDYVAKISDMGLGKQFVGQSSYGASLLADAPSLRGQSNGGQESSPPSVTGGVGPGSVGWQAPEVMALRVVRRTNSTRSDGGSNHLTTGSVGGAGGGGGRGGGGSHESSFHDGSSPDSYSYANAAPAAAPPRTSRSVDIFSLGCIFHSTLIPGSHPFGEWYEREANIMHNRPQTRTLDSVSADAHDLVQAMIHRDPAARPTADQICDHPFFWTPERRLAFLCDFSDRLEIDATRAEQRQQNHQQQQQHPQNDVKEPLPSLPSSSSTTSLAARELLAVERNAARVLGGVSWDAVLDVDLVSNVQRFRTYDPSSVRDLLRLIRNKHHHYDELPDRLKRQMGHSNTSGLVRYFEERFPRLVIHCWTVCRALLRRDDPLSRKYRIAPAIGGRLMNPVSVNRASSNGSDDDRCTALRKETDAGSIVIAEEKGSVHESLTTMSTERLLDHANSAAVVDGDDDNERGDGSIANLPLPSNPRQAQPLWKEDDDDATTEGESSEPVASNVVPSKDPDAAKADAASKGQDPKESPVVDADRHMGPRSTEETAAAAAVPSLPGFDGNGIVVWEGSAAAKSFRCRGWSRSDDEWIRAGTRDAARWRNKRDLANLMRCKDDPKFRTRLCNHWDSSMGTSCPMRRRNRCVFAHGPAELRVKEGKRRRWGKLVDQNGDNKNPRHSGGEDPYGAARSIETERKQEGKWNIDNNKNNGNSNSNNAQGNKGGNSKLKQRKAPHPKKKKTSND